MSQTFCAEMDILIIDNFSTDGTFDTIAEYSGEKDVRIQYFNPGYNSGGAGGFCYGMRKAAEKGYQYIWTMDDDCIPSSDALEKLLNYETGHPYENGFLCSKVIWRDGSACTMNIPRETVFRPLDLYKENNPEVKMASFVSLFIPVRVVRDVGLPMRKFFIWTDDWEYTRRISRKYPCRMISSSTVVHDMEENRKADISSDDSDRVWRYRYLYRNDVYLYRREGLKGGLYQAVRLPAHIARVVLSNNSLKEKIIRIGAIVKGTAEGVHFFPEPERALLRDEDHSNDHKQLRILEAFGEPFTYGGQETFVMNVLKNMDTDGLAIDILTPYYCDHQMIKETIHQLGGEIHALGCRFNPGGVRANVLVPLTRFLSSHTYDVIHIHSGSNSMLAVYSYLAYTAGIRRIIVHSHSTGDPGMKHIAAKSITRTALDKYPTDWCACSFEAGEWRFSRRTCTEKLKVINNGTDAELFRYDEENRIRTRKLLGIDEDTVIIGNVGRLDRNKNQSFLIELLREIRMRAGKGTDYRLLLVGHGEKLEDLLEQAEMYGLSDYVIFTGQTDDVRSYYHAMDVLAVPSNYEGYGIVIIEGQAAGLEVIASDRVPQTVRTTESVLLLSLEDREAWIESLMKKHIRHPEYADIISGSDHSIRIAAEKVRALYFDEQ